MYGISFHQERCIQCHGCETACKNWRGVETGVRWRRVQNLWSGRYPQVKCTSVSVACLHCVEPACAEACPEGAIAKRAEDGLVAVDREKCTGCRLCLDACPFHVPQFGASGIMEKCDLCQGRIEPDCECPPCVATCPTGALVFETMSEAEKAAEERVLGSLSAGRPAKHLTGSSQLNDSRPP